MVVVRNVCHIVRSSTSYNVSGTLGIDKEYKCNMSLRARILSLRAVMNEKEHVVSGLYTEFLIFLWKNCDV